MGQVKWNELFNPGLLEQRQKSNPFVKLNDMVYSILEEAIISFSIPPATKLSPVRLAACLGISRTPVTEALGALEQNGLVTSPDSGKGYYVFDITHVSLKNLFVARAALEGAAAGLCARRCMELRLSDMERLAKLFYTSFEKKYFNRYAMIDQAFHNLIVNSCGNPLIIKMYRTIEKLNTYYSIRSQDYLMGMGNDPELKAVAGQHLAIYRAIEMGMPDLAERSVKDHLDMGYSMCMRYHMTIGENAQCIKAP